MRLDHLAFRVRDRHKTVDFFIKAFGYKVQTEFDIQFDDGSVTKCFALEPPEKNEEMEFEDWTTSISHVELQDVYQEYHLPPEIFVSDGSPNSIVGQWVAARNGVGGIHHIAYQVDSVQEKMAEWRAKGYAEFTTEQPLTCPGLTQVFTKPSALTGIVFEFIERGEHGFCAENVKQLMISTDNLT